MIVDLHNHTKLCKHATGELFEYVEKAIKDKTKYFGFSDHAPMNFDEKYRMNFNEMNFYENSIKNIKEKYKDKITILLGYEADFLPGHLDERIFNAKVDYLIGSVHFVDNWGFDDPEFIGTYKEKNTDEIWEKYFNSIKEMAKSGKYNIVGHIDLIKIFNFKPKKEIKMIAKDAIKAIKKADMVVELNSAGYRKPCKEAYPSLELLEMISEYDIPITFGSDAHKPNQVGYKSNELITLAKKCGYNKCAYFIEKDRKLINF